MILLSYLWFCVECAHGLQSDLLALCPSCYSGPLQDPGQDAGSGLALRHTSLQVESHRGRNKDHHQVGVVWVELLMASLV